MKKVILAVVIVMCSVVAQARELQIFEVRCVVDKKEWKVPYTSETRQPLAYERKVCNQFADDLYKWGLKRK